MTKENNSNQISENVKEVMNTLNLMGIKPQTPRLADDGTSRIQFIYENFAFTITVREKLVDIIAHLGILLTTDPRLGAFKEGANFTNFNLISDRILWDGPDPEGYIWFHARKTIPIEKFSISKLIFALNFDLRIKDIWVENCVKFMEPDLSNLESQMN